MLNLCVYKYIWAEGCLYTDIGCRNLCNNQTEKKEGFYKSGWISGEEYLDKLFL